MIYDDADSLAAMEAEGQQFKEKYYRDTQFVASRVQHHVHKKDKSTGTYQPLNACAKTCRGKKRKDPDAVCKHDFPRKVLPAETFLVCKGLAKKYGLKVRGRRNVYAMLLGRRKSRWQSGFTPALASHFRSNSHTMPGYRVPPIAETHESACSSFSCQQQCKLAAGDKKALAKIAKRSQRVQRECTGCGCLLLWKLFLLCLCS
jgi:hypothetical protein